MPRHCVDCGTKLKRRESSYYSDSDYSECASCKKYFIVFFNETKNCKIYDFIDNIDELFEEFLNLCKDGSWSVTDNINCYKTEHVD